MRRTASIASIVIGVLLILGGVATWIVVSTTLNEQQITVSDDASCLAGDEVNGPFSAYCEATVIETHALEATGGMYYSQSRPGGSAEGGGNECRFPPGVVVHLCGGVRRRWDGDLGRCALRADRDGHQGCRRANGGRHYLTAVRPGWAVCRPLRAGPMTNGPRVSPGASTLADVQELTENEARDLLEIADVAHLGVIADGEPYVTAVSFVISGNLFLFRTGPGRRLRAIERGSPVCVEVSEYDSETGDWAKRRGRRAGFGDRRCRAGGGHRGCPLRQVPQGDRIERDVEGRGGLGGGIGDDGEDQRSLIREGVGTPDPPRSTVRCGQRSWKESYCLRRRACTSSSGTP